MEKETNGNTAGSEKITLEKFAEEVRQMRYQQRRYFAYRRPEVLERSKELERRVDRIVDEILNNQPQLF